MSYMNATKLTAMLAGLEDSDGVARVVDVNTASASATKDHPAAPEAEANSNGEAAGAADTVTAGDGDGVTPTIQDAINKGVQVGEDVTKMESAHAALEHYISKVQECIDANESVPKSLAAAIQVGLHRHDRNFFKRTVPGLESFEAPVGRMTVSLELLDKLKEGAKSVAAGIVAAVKKMFELLMNAWNFVSTDRVKLMERLNAAKKTIQGAEIPKDLAIDYGGLGALFMDGDIAGSDPKSLETLMAVSDGVMVKWPQQILTLSKQIHSKLNAPDFDIENDEACVAVVVAALTALGASYASLLGGFVTANGNPVISDLLPGNRRVTFSYSPDLAKDPKVNMHNLSSVFEITHGVDKTVKALDKSVTVPSKEDLVRGIAKTAELIDFGTKRAESSAAIRDYLADIKMNSAGVSIVYSFCRAALKSSTSYLGYLNTTTKAYVSYYEKVAAAATKGKKDE